MGQRRGCYVASYAPGNIADKGLLCKDMAFTRARVVSSTAPTKVIDAWVTHAGMDCLKSFNDPQYHFTSHWRLNLLSDPKISPTNWRRTPSRSSWTVSVSGSRHGQAHHQRRQAPRISLPYLEGFSDEPHFRSKTQHRGNVAMTVATLRSRLNTAAAANNLPGSSMSCLRRDFTQHFLTMVERHSVEVLIGHRQRQATRDKRYGRGSAGIDVARLRLDEVEAPHAYRNELMLKDLEERAWQGFAMHTLGLSRGGGDKCTELDDDADANHLGPIRVAKGASAQKKPYRTLDVSVQSLGAKYDVVRTAGKEMQAALDQVQLATKVEIAIDNWMLKNLKKLAAEPFVSTSHAAKKAVGATLSAHSDVTDALALARDRENASKGKEKRPMFGATIFANVSDAAVAIDVRKARAAARFRAIKHCARKRQSSDEELGKGSPYLLHTTAVQTAVGQDQRADEELGIR